MERILVILSSMNAGGAETFLMKLYRAFDKTKYQLDFCINVKEKCFYEDEINALGGRVYRIPSKSENLKEFRKQLYSIIKDEKYERVLRITSNAMGFMEMKIAKKAGAKIRAIRSSNSSDGGSIKTKVFHILGKLLYGRYVNVKIAPSDLAAQYTFGKKAYKNGEVSILHNAIDLDVYKYSEESRNAIRNEFGLENKTVIGHIGRFNTQKNHAFLLKIFAEIVKRDSNSILMLVGKGDLESAIREQAKELGVLEKIIFTGVRSDVPALLSAMDVFVMPSFYEGMPNTVIEAQATGLPCVIADTITKEANITGLVDYMSLNEKPSNWAIKSIKKLSTYRMGVNDYFIANEYDIESVVNKFIHMLD